MYIYTVYIRYCSYQCSEKEILSKHELICGSLKRPLFAQGMPPYVHCNQPTITSKLLQEMSYSMVQLLIS